MEVYSEIQDSKYQLMNIIVVRTNYVLLVEQRNI